MPLASTWKNSTFCIGKTLKRAANSNGLRGPDVPKNNHHSTAASAILLLTTVWGARGMGWAEQAGDTRSQHLLCTQLSPPRQSPAAPQTVSSQFFADGKAEIGERWDMLTPIPFPTLLVSQRELTQH